MRHPRPLRWFYLYAGTGFLLVRREVYLTMQRKLQLPVCNERFGHPMIPFYLPMIRPIEEGTWYLAEDYAFCERARQCGFRIYADTAIRLSHIGTHRYGWEDAGMERPRFDNFTLNFNDAASMPAAMEAGQPAVLANFAAQYPWPPQKPDVPPFPQRDWLHKGTTDFLTRSVSQTTKLIVEVGSSTGRSARFLSSLAPGATVVAIDHWEGSPEQKNDPQLAPFLPRLYETFLAECWSYRDQIVPVKAKSVEGLQRVADAGLQADLVFIDADHAFDSVVSHLSLALDLFPRAVIVGDDYDWDEVCRAVETVARDRGLRCESVGPGWRLLRQTAPEEHSEGGR
ncbi:MAG: class I SAM-dependent methyltransferase [Thermoguttaceae bacterium]